MASISQMRKFSFSCFTIALLLLLFAFTTKGFELTPSYESVSIQKRAVPFGSADVLKLSKREATLNYNTAITKGTALLTKVKAADSATLKSAFTAYTELATWGWTDTKKTVTASLTAALADAFTTLKVSSANDVEWQQDHAKDKTIDGVDYEHTDGYFKNIYNIAGGLILADDNTSPAAMEDTWTAAQLPKLRNWSDVVFLKWQELAGTSVKNLKYVLRSNVVNDPSLDVLKIVFGLTLTDTEATLVKTIPLWAAKKTFLMTTDQGKALLGTPNGSGAAWILINHKAELGMKTITEVTVWKALDASTKKDMIMMLFTYGS